LTAKSYNKE